MERKITEGMRRKYETMKYLFGNGRININKARVLVLPSSLNVSFVMDVVELSVVKFFIFI